MIVQALTAFSVISYFHVLKEHPETANWFRTFLAPLLGGIGMLYVIYLLGKNAEFAAGLRQRPATGSSPRFRGWETSPI